MIPKVLFLGTGGVSDAVRLDLPAKELSRRGSLIPVLKGVGEMHQHERLQTVLNNIDEESIIKNIKRIHSDPYESKRAATNSSPLNLSRSSISSPIPT